MHRLFNKIHILICIYFRLICIWHTSKSACLHGNLTHHEIWIQPPLLPYKTTKSPEISRGTHYGAGLLSSTALCPAVG